MNNNDRQEYFAEDRIIKQTRRENMTEENREDFLEINQKIRKLKTEYFTELKDKGG